MAFTFQQPGTTSVLTAIETAATGADDGLGVFAFATAGGVKALFAVPSVQAMLHAKKPFHLIVGVDAITNASALLQIADMKTKYGASLTAEVFYHSHPASTFHPKFLQFSHGLSTTVVTGSGNLTPQGLGVQSAAAPPPGNWEAFSVEQLAAADATTLRAAIAQWIKTHRGSLMLRPLSDEAVRTKAMANGLVRYRGGAAPTPKKVPPIAGVPIVVVPTVVPVPNGLPTAGEDILVRELPRNRPGQADIGKEALSAFFGYAGKAKSILLQHVSLDDQLGQTESIRLFVNDSQNYRLELHAMKGLKYAIGPGDGRMILVATKLDERSFRYTLVAVGAPGHADLIGLLGPIAKGRRFMREKVVSGAELKAAWPVAPTGLLPIVADVPAL